MFLDRSGGLARRLPMRQMLTSWTSLYGAMRRHFPAEHYHQGAELTDFGQSAERVEARFADGHEVTGGLLVAAEWRWVLRAAPPDAGGARRLCGLCRLARSR